MLDTLRGAYRGQRTAHQAWRPVENCSIEMINDLHLRTLPAQADQAPVSSDRRSVATELSMVRT